MFAFQEVIILLQFVFAARFKRQIIRQSIQREDIFVAHPVRFPNFEIASVFFGQPFYKLQRHFRLLVLSMIPQIRDHVLLFVAKELFVQSHEQLLFQTVVTESYVEEAPSMLPDLVDGYSEHVQEDRHQKLIGILVYET